MEDPFLQIRSHICTCLECNKILQELCNHDYKMIDKVIAKHFLFNILFYRQNEIFISDSLRHSNHVTKEFEMPQNSNGCGV